MKGLKSAFYVGRVSHSRLQPKVHSFSYPSFMAYVDLEEVSFLFDGIPFYSTRSSNLVRFKRSDYYGDPDRDLAQEIRDLVFTRTQLRVEGPVRMLTHLRHFGHCFNPVTFYYVFAKGQDSKVQAIVAEITNTPWNERHTYVLPVSGTDLDGDLVFDFHKEFHVSPFMPMDLDYVWNFSLPSRTLAVTMRNMQGDQKIFSASLNLKRVEITRRSSLGLLASFPFLSLNVLRAIYWQAFRLWLRGTPVFKHPILKKDNL
ncbi:MAG: DUF1365 domain-containing protein [Bdellovibrionota bacterium]